MEVGLNREPSAVVWKRENEHLSELLTGLDGRVSHWTVCPHLNEGITAAL